MYKFGLKLLSTNTDYYFDEAKRLYADGIFSYVELFVVPDTLQTIDKWKTLNIPINLHCPHFMHGFNLAKREKEKSNCVIYNQVKRFADELNSEYIVFHAGVDENIEETVRQLGSFNEPRAVIENKPYRAVPNKMNGTFCRGAIIPEIRYILSEVECGFCLDVGHAICSANSQKLDKWKYIEEFNELKPNMYHLTDSFDNSEFDQHWHIGDGTLCMKRILSFIKDGSKITVETKKDNERDLLDFEKDIILLRGSFNALQMHKK
ncbi:MAG: TIM barrel protein [Holosporaceae bacterium]|jgi:sugar phosphate isomerase/epimerase|nr:TIM barrel protein [Holosporaceae bacterium]